MRNVKISEIIEAVANYHDVSYEAILGKTRKQSAVRARQCCYQLAKLLTIKSIAEIGDVFSRNHTTIIHGLHKDLPEVNELRAELDAKTSH